ncbi:DNA-processing protein DprA [Paenibacillus sp. F411]|uniref:DNA-processing protein DprA n=1 Tax=Paenibacillus sp. F411 TaxID=2820239 RepID=UPI001AAED7B1|nr:DNA-processing protein DprA [Paenibacillus sp. F411]MBO2945767.1 DNA-processing protein DprA [Paenibacillus sp. F411]
MSTSPRYEKAMLVALHETEGIGWKTIDNLYASGLHMDMCSYGVKDWTAMGIRVEAAHRLSLHFAEAVENAGNRLSKEQNEGIRVICILDSMYPDMLKSSPRPPWVMYARGSLDLLNGPSLAVVGTRVPTAYGRKVATLLTEDLVTKGVTIVSGLARGIDSIAHAAALKQNGKTIAVLGAGVDTIYPPENRTLYEEIAQQGLLLSEYPPGTGAHPGYFPQRNRIIAGITLGTLVVEADIRSGSLITSDAALEAGRDVFAVPGPITSPKSRGTLELIKQGAKLVTAIEDITEEYQRQLKEAAEKSSVGAHTYTKDYASSVDGLTKEEMELYHMLQQGPGSVDELLERTRWEFGLLHSVLLSLIIKKQITQLPGAIYKLI